VYAFLGPTIGKEGLDEFVDLSGCLHLQRVPGVLDDL
jgi:hypothetical protein